MSTITSLNLLGVVGTVVGALMLCIAAVLIGCSIEFALRKPYTPLEKDTPAYVTGLLVAVGGVLVWGSRLLFTVAGALVKCGW